VYADELICIALLSALRANCGVIEPRTARVVLKPRMLPHMQGGKAPVAQWRSSGLSEDQLTLAFA